MSNKKYDNFTHTHALTGTYIHTYIQFIHTYAFLRKCLWQGTPTFLIVARGQSPDQDNSVNKQIQSMELTADECTFGELDVDPFRSLCRHVIYQQLSFRAACKIWKRVKMAVGEPFSSQRILQETSSQTAFNRLLSTGITKNKANTILNLAHQFERGELTSEFLCSSSIDEVSTRLLRIKGLLLISIYLSIF